MTEGTAEVAGHDDAAEHAVVEYERAEVERFAQGLPWDDVVSGDWFAKLLAHALHTYTAKANAQYFRDRYPGMPIDGVVDERIRAAARNAAIKGGLSASAYSAAVVTTIGSRGGASRAALPAAAASLIYDVAFVTRMQLRLVYDIAVLYQIPLDLSDPEDMWMLVRAILPVKAGEVTRSVVIKAAPEAARQVVKRFYSGAALTTAKSFPIVGKHLLQRTVIKTGIPVLGVPTAVVMNHRTTKAAGRHAKKIFREEARLVELARRLSQRTRHPELMLWVAWMVIRADQNTSAAEKTLFRYLGMMVRDQHQMSVDELGSVVDFRPGDVWERLDATPGDLSDIVAMAEEIAVADGPANGSERAVLAEVRDRCRRT
ncbi:hypothetical protein DER29_6014 [Micromonospora sp. M71_S20]|uniref:hypothetical protein n=1 Tax=Micromonospora sp. M71_S20 TaxID=592872 RepID=UPI000EAB80A4|nr:hypothetical protein [Micromonospora sp. M71_S20]RLK09510.1 hypothetical protein DER29_6014 [Micromonospora sp. M71_S20]